MPHFFPGRAYVFKKNKTHCTFMSCVVREKKNGIRDLPLFGTSGSCEKTAKEKVILTIDDLSFS